MISERLDKVIRTVPDFPKEGISFKDITPLLMDAQLTNSIIKAFVNELNDDMFGDVFKLTESTFDLSWLEEESSFKYK